MLIEFTAEEQQHIQKIQADYAPEREQLQLAIEEARAAGAGKNELLKLRKRQQALLDSLQEELEAYSDKCQRERFKRIQAGGADAIIAHAKEQAPVILEYIHRDTVRDYGRLTPAALKELRIGTAKQGAIYVNANNATAWLKDELRLHIEALIDDKAHLQELLETIIEAVESSPYTDNEEITDRTERPLEVMRFRRNPLSDITKYGIMNDKTATQIIQDGEVFQQKADGQLVLRWAVDQAPQEEEAVPVYMALTSIADNFKMAKRLTAYDKQVYEAVATRFYYWQRENPQKPLYITPQEIWRTMNGKKSGGSKISNPSAAQVKRICDSIDKMRHIDFYMDISEEIKAHYITLEDERLTGGYIKDYLLNCSETGFYTEKGNTVHGYKVREEPILFTYNKAKRRILLVDYELLDTSSYVSDSENVTEFKGYLLQQIQLMKNAAKGGKRFKRSNIILLDTIYKSTGIQPPEERIAGKEYKTEGSRQKEVRRFRQADRQKIEGLLEAWKAKGWIKGYTILNSKNEPLKEKQQAKGYSISV